MTPPQSMRVALQPSATFTATKSVAPAQQRLRRFRVLEITLDVTAADAGGTYDIYVTTGDGTANWDLVHFGQIAGSAKRYVARVYQDLLPQVVASNGTVTQEGNLDILVTNAVKTLAAGSVRNGAWADNLGYELVAGGAPTTGITFSLTGSARAA
jgi:hypothetical protein